MHLKKGFFLLILHFFLISNHSQAVNHPSTEFIIDTVMEEYGSIIDHIEIYLDKKTDKTLDEIIHDEGIFFEDMDESVILDKNYFFQIVENLVSNAIKFSPQGKEVFVKTYSENGKACLEVMDEGPGFNEDDKKKLFEKFQKLSAKPTGGESTTGLGLSIIKKFVEAMNGNIKLQSDVDKGACFIIEFERK